MKATLLFCAIAIAFVALSSATRCDIRCPRTIKPVCGQLNTNKNVRCTFRSECTLRTRNCQTRQNWIIVNEGKCKQDNPNCRRLRG